MTAAAIWPAIDTLIPHRGDMLLVGHIVAAPADAIVVEAQIGADNLFRMPGFGVPGWIGFEMMAQTVASYDGLKRHRQGLPPSIGFLVACKQYICGLDWFQTGDRFHLDARPMMDDSETMMFECTMSRIDGANVAKAQLMVYQPKDVAGFLGQT